MYLFYIKIEFIVLIGLLCSDLLEKVWIDLWELVVDVFIYWRVFVLGLGVRWIVCFIYWFIFVVLGMVYSDYKYIEDYDINIYICLRLFW